MNFLNYLKVYEKEDTVNVEKIIEDENIKMNAIFKEAFYGEFTSKIEAKIRIENEFTDEDKVPEGVDIQYVKENVEKIKDKIDTLTEGDIRIIIHNNEASGGVQTPVISMPVSMDGEMPCEEKKKRGRPKKKADEYDNSPDEKYKEEEVVKDEKEEKEEVELKDEEKEVDEKCGEDNKEKKVEEEEVDEKKEEKEEEVVDEKKEEVKEEIDDETFPPVEDLEEPEEGEELPTDEDEIKIKWSDIEDKLEEIDDKLETLIDKDEEKEKEE